MDVVINSKKSGMNLSLKFGHALFDIYRHLQSLYYTFPYNPLGTSKSQMLQYVYNLVPRGQYTSGKGSSATGLTAYITRDPDTRQVVLQTGQFLLIKAVNMLHLLYVIYHYVIL